MTDCIDGARRRVLQLGLTAIAFSAVSKPALAAIPRPKGEKALSFLNLHTGERLRVAYWRDGLYVKPAFERINHILRDHRTGEVYPINAGLMDLLYDLQKSLRHHSTIEIISGYRSPRTNAMLASASDGVAKRSLHTEGKAIDIRITGVSLRQVHTAALFLRRGGVGFYPSSGFVHVDIGRVRSW